MKTVIFLLLLTGLLSVSSKAQSLKKVAGYIQVQYNQTLYDRTKGNNQWGMGTGALFVKKLSNAFGIIGEFTADYNFMDDKVLRWDENDSPIPTVKGVISLYAGISVSPGSKGFLTVAGGSVAAGGRILPGVKTSLGYYFTAKQKWLARFAYSNIFNRVKGSGEDFGTFSISIGARIF